MAEIFAIIEAMRQHFNWDKTDTYPFLISALEAEIGELKAATTDDEIAGELADVLMYALTIATIKGFDVQQIIAAKAEVVKRREY